MEYTLNLRGGTFYVNAVLKNGDRLRESTGRTDRAKADQEALRMIKVANQRLAAGGKKTLKQGFAKMWERGERWNPSDKALGDPESKLQQSRWIMEQLGEDFPIDKVDTDEINKLRAKLLSGGDRTEATVQRYIHTLTSMLRQAATDWGWINTLPTYKKLKKSKENKRWLQEDEIIRLLAAEWRPKYKRLWLFLLDTGARLGETLKLTWSDIDFKANTVDFRRQTTKADDDKGLPLSVEQMVDLKATKAAGAIRPFPLNKNTCQSYFYMVRDKAGLTPAEDTDSLSVHTLRHTCASHIVRRTGNLKLAQAQLGHSDIGTTARYAKADMRQLEPLAGWASKLVK